MYSCTVQCILDYVLSVKFLVILLAEKMTETKIENGNANQNGDSVENRTAKMNSEVDAKPEVESKPVVEANPVKRDLDDSDDESPAGKHQINFLPSLLNSSKEIESL